MLYPGTALDWIRSYFCDRFQYVSIDGADSQRHLLEYGVPQGSVLGPFGFPKYSSPVIKIFKKYNIQYHLYADDVQLYVVFKPGNTASAQANLSACIKELEACIAETQDWMSSNMLKFNGDKTEFMIIGTKQMLQKVPGTHTIHVEGSDIQAASSARNIGVVMDQTLCMDEHIKGVCRSSYMHLRNISRIRKYLTKDACATIIHSLVISRLDNLNSLLYGLPDSTLRKLQLIQNQAAKLVVKKKKYDHITPILIELHWLPVEYRIQYKILLLTHQCLHGKAPRYLSALLHPYEPSRSLRSENQFLLKENKMRLKTYGDRAFSSCAPRLWNLIPVHLRKCEEIGIFKKDLKTHLFKLAFKV